MNKFNFLPTRDIFPSLEATKFFLYFCFKFPVTRTFIPSTTGLDIFIAQVSFFSLSLYPKIKPF